MPFKSRINSFNLWIALYVFVALLELVGEAFSFNFLIYATKPLLIPILIVFLHQKTKKDTPSLTSLYIALLFSAIGDDLLLFTSINDSFFLFGLLSFLVTQVFYCFIFYKMISWKMNKGIFFIVVFFYSLYLLGLLSLVYPTLGDLKVPVLIYAFVITIMGVLGTITGIQYKNKFILFGAFIFIVSDSFIALNKFYFNLSYAELLQVIIMSTYVLAQPFLVIGVIRNKRQ